MHGEGRVGYMDTLERKRGGMKKRGGNEREMRGGGGGMKEKWGVGW